MPKSPSQARLYVAYFDGEVENDTVFSKLDYTELQPNLYLVRSDQTQSKLYHLLKRRAKPDALFVGACDGDPKFKGMAEGSTKWVRQG